MSTPKAEKGTKVPPAKKETPAPAAAATPTQEPTPAPAAAAPVIPKSPGKIAQIIDLHKAGKTNKEIAECHVDGDITKEKFHKTTISIQVTKFLKSDPDSAAKLAKTRQDAKDLKAKEKAEEKAKGIAAKEASKKAKKEAAEIAKVEKAASATAAKNVTAGA